MVRFYMFAVWVIPCQNGLDVHDLAFTEVFIFTPTYDKKVLLAKYDFW